MLPTTSDINVESQPIDKVCNCTYLKLTFLAWYKLGGKQFCQARREVMKTAHMSSEMPRLPYQKELIG
ncbi:hypothetical protein [Lysinibacillus sp. 3P01SB]|uniref:hypothetical protein n=1 Tax=Lysinibacillus sp. 3P01SB TaxID=3132284 RepID=UPI0039A43487